MGINTLAGVPSIVFGLFGLAFFCLGELIEYDQTTKIFSNPTKKETEDYVTGRFG